MSCKSRHGDCGGRSNFSLSDLTVLGADEMKLRVNVQSLDCALSRLVSLSRSKQLWLALMSAACLLLAASALPQGIATGSISGMVADPAGAVVAGARVTAVNTATNEHSHAITFHRLPTQLS